MDLPGSQHGSHASGGGAGGGGATHTARRLAGQLAQSAGRTVQQWTVRKYTLPDKNVASQVLMYRQLLHTKCRPGLKLSRDYQATVVQKAVAHMPWWSEGMMETGKMIISYDNLIRRLWLDGAILVHDKDTTTELDTLLDEDGLPPVPHPYWVNRLGFQQPDPVTDFRSGGVLSLALMVHVVESCPLVFQRFVRPTGDASVLPFGITSINLTDMIATFLMFAKKVDRMDALLSQKPFWNMFADPNAILVCKELAMDMLADIVVELRTEREYAQAKDAAAVEASTGDDSSPPREQKDLVTVFDFAYILERTERRVEDDLLGSGPQSVIELRSIHSKLKTKYSAQFELRLQRLMAPDAAAAEGASTMGGAAALPPAAPAPGDVKAQVLHHATGLATGASAFAGTLFSKIKAPGFNPVKPATLATAAPTFAAAPTVAVIPPKKETVQAPTTGDAATITPDLLSGSPPKTTASTAAAAAVEPTLAAADVDSDGDWSKIQAATEGVSNFSIAGDDDDEEYL